MKRTSSYCYLSHAGFFVWVQNRQITGIVSSSNGNTLLDGAIVTVKGISTSLATNS